MNTIVATVIKIDNIDNLNIVNFTFDNQTLSMMSLDLSDDIKIGVRVKLMANPSHIAIAKELNGMVSYSNQLKAKIVEIDNGKLLSSIRLLVGEDSLESIITFRSSQKMNLKIGDDVTALIKASELSILEVL